LGTKAFRKELLAQVSEQRGAHYYGPELQEGEEERAERLVRGELARQGWAEQDLAEQPKTEREQSTHGVAPAT